MMTRQQTILVLHAALLIGALFLLVPMLTGWDSRAGYLFVLLFYWLLFCLPVIGWHALPGNEGQLFSERLPWRDWWLLPALLAQVGVIAIISFVPNTSMLSNGGMWMACLFAAINGPLEEIAWRGGFMSTFRERPRLGFWLGWLLFCVSHLPFALALGVTFEGGVWVFIGWAAALGLFWNCVAWRTGSVFYVALAHLLTNVFSFWVLFDRNGWPHYAWQP